MGLMKIDNVSYRYDGAGKNVLSGVSAEFVAGKVYAIVGKSGAGKSTLLSLLSGLDVCEQGAILYDGKDLKQIDRDVYRAKSVGVVFQSYNLLLNATAVENIVLSMDISGVGSDVLGAMDKKAYAHKLLEDVGIDRETAAGRF